MGLTGHMPAPDDHYPWPPTDGLVYYSSPPVSLEGGDSFPTGPRQASYNTSATRLSVTSPTNGVGPKPFGKTVTIKYGI